jgi:hypothetical protein
MTHGGKRIGAGRKPSPEPSKRIAVPIGAIDMVRILIKHYKRRKK